jgi:hypothetical protein
MNRWSLKGAFLLASAAASIGAAPGIHAQQQPDGSASRAAIAKLDFMVGTWRGEAWMQLGAGERVQTTMTETVERKLNGAVLQVEGLGVVPATGGTQARVVHNAFAIISFDAQANTYNMRSYLANGLAGDFVVTLIPGGVSWTREVPGGRVRNTARYTSTEWHEVGEFSRDGTAWTQVMEIRLRKAQ